MSNEIIENYEKSVHEDEEKELKHFNWGAWYFTWFWGIFNKCFKKTFVPWIIAIVITFFVPTILGFIINIGVSIYIGINGNRWAYSNKDWGDIQVFRSHQRAWSIATIIMFLLSILLFIISFAFFSTLFAGYHNDTNNYKSTQNIEEQIQYQNFRENQPIEQNYSDDSEETEDYEDDTDVEEEEEEEEEE